MGFLYAISGAWGISTGIWIDTLSMCSPNSNLTSGTGQNVCDPALALVAPLLIGTAAPVGFFLWDNFAGMHRGVPMSIGTGILIGAAEGFGVAGVQAASSSTPWGSDGIMTSIFVGSTVGGIGGWAFGEAVRPDPRKMTLVASGAGWGSAMGMLLGGGAANSDPQSMSQGVLVGNLVGINVGIAATGVMAAVGWDPSWRALEWMWAGAAIGLAATSPIYLFYIGKNDAAGHWQGNHGMVANAFGILAGIVISGIATRDLKDPTEPEPTPTPSAAPPGPGGQPVGTPAGPTARRTKPAWRPPFNVSIAPLPNGASLGIFGEW